MIEVEDFTIRVCREEAAANFCELLRMFYNAMSFMKIEVMVLNSLPLLYIFISLCLPNSSILLLFLCLQG